MDGDLVAVVRSVNEWKCSIYKEIKWLYSAIACFY